MLSERGGGLVGVVPTAAFADNAMACTQVLEEIDGLGGSLLLQPFPVRRGHRIGQVDGGLLEGGAGHRGLFEENRRGFQAQFDFGGGAGLDHDGRGCRGVADQFDGHFMLPDRDVEKGEAPLFVRRSSQVESREVDQGGFEGMSTGGVDDGDGNGTGRLRLHRSDSEDGRTCQYRNAPVPSFHQRCSLIDREDPKGPERCQISNPVTMGILPWLRTSFVRAQSLRAKH